MRFPTSTTAAFESKVTEMGWCSLPPANATADDLDRIIGSMDFVLEGVTTVGKSTGAAFGHGWFFSLSL